MEEKKLLAEANPITTSTSEARAGQRLRPLCQILGKGLKKLLVAIYILPKTGQEFQVPVYENQEEQFDLTRLIFATNVFCC